MKKLVVTLVGASLAAAVMQAKAEDVGGGFDLSMNAGIVSDYLFRGISQSANTGAWQGGVDLKHSSGAYVGTWLSSLNTGFANAEQDIYGGYGYSVTPDIALDVHVIKYTYLGVAADNLLETHVGGTISNLATTGDSLTAGADYSNDVPFGIGSTLNYNVSYSYPLPMDMTLAATVGDYSFKGDKAFGTKSTYTYWNLGVSKKLAGITLAISYNDTNLTDANCAAYAAAIGGDKDSCGNQVVLSATKAL